MAAGGSRDALLVAALAVGSTWAEAADAAHCSERTVGRRLHDPGFVNRLREARARIFDSAMAEAAASLALANKTLRDIAADEGAPSSARVSAAGRLWEVTLRATELRELADRIAALEAAVATTGGTT